MRKEKLRQKELQKQNKKSLLQKIKEKDIFEKNKRQDRRNKLLHLILIQKMLKEVQKS